MPRIVDHDRQREVLLDASLRLFADEGYAGATMRRIARAAGVSTGTLYHYFPDKLAIVSGVLDRMVARDVALVRAEVAPDAPLPARVGAVFGFVRRRRQHLADLMRVALEVQRVEPDQGEARVRAGMAVYREAVTELLGAGDAVGAVALELVLGGILHELLEGVPTDLDAREAFVLAMVAASGAG